MILSELKKVFDSKFGPDWYEYEMETLSFELGAQFNEKTVQKIVMIKVVHDDLNLMLNDADYFLRFVEVANGHVVDAHYHDIPTCLELDYALRELRRLAGKENVPVTPMLNNVTRYVINDQGHGEAYSDILSEYSGIPQVHNDKTKAASMYDIAMAKHKGEG